EGRAIWMSQFHGCLRSSRMGAILRSRACQKAVNWAIACFRPGKTLVADTDTHRRFSATRLAAHRSRLGLSAAAYGKLIGMSGATIFLWEQGKSRPSAAQLQRLAAVRALGKRAALEKAAE
ncbi:MAG: helix-turn-helix domain-containing protein, partial [Proteobacteria bacterium]|nr:helix-turn-helix domain-containing protein [Pseudomonadota bacterium]